MGVSEPQDLLESKYVNIGEILTHLKNSSTLLKGGIICVNVKKIVKVSK